MLLAPGGDQIVVLAVADRPADHEQQHLGQGGSRRTPRAASAGTTDLPCFHCPHPRGPGERSLTVLIALLPSRSTGRPCCGPRRSKPCDVIAIWARAQHSATVRRSLRSEPG